MTNLDFDGNSQLSYSEILSYEDQPISTTSQSPCERGDIRHHSPSYQGTSVVRSLSRQSTEGSLETETAFNNRGFEDSYATDSSSVCSPEASYLLSVLCFRIVYSLVSLSFFFPHWSLSSSFPSPNFSRK